MSSCHLDKKICTLVFNHIYAYICTTIMYIVVLVYYSYLILFYRFLFILLPTPPSNRFPPGHLYGDIPRKWISWVETGGISINWGDYGGPVPHTDCWYTGDKHPSWNLIMATLSVRKGISNWFPPSLLAPGILHQSIWKLWVAVLPHRALCWHTISYKQNKNAKVEALPQVSPLYDQA